MADINRELEELAELTQRVNAEFARYGQLTRETADQIKDAEMQQKHGIKNFTEASGKGAEAVVNLGKAMGQAASSMYQGKKGAAAFNDSVDSLTTAAKAAAAGLMLLGGPLGLLAGAVLAGVAALGEYTKAANEMSDKLYKGYQGLAESGAAASDGMTGLFEDAKKLSLSMNDLDGYVQLIGENSKDLALFSGTVFEGRKQFANMGKSMEKYQESFFNMGLSVEQVNAGMMGYLKLQSRVGLSQNKTTDQLADGARKYLLEMDELTKVTGIQRKEAEQVMEAGRNEQRFRAKLDAMRATKDEKQLAAADRMERANVLVSKFAPQMAEAVRDTQSGVVTSAAAQKGLISSQGELLRLNEMLQKGQINEYEYVQRLGKSVGEFNKSLNMTAQLGALNDFAVDYAQGQELSIFAMKDRTEQEKIAAEELKKQGGKGGKAADSLVQAQTDLRQAQIAGNNATERFVFEGVEPATKAMAVLAKTTTAGTESLNKLFGINQSKEKTPAEKAADAAATAARAAEQTAREVIKNKDSTEEQKKAALNKSWDARKAEQQAVNPGPVILNKKPAPAAPVPAAPAPAPAAPAPAAPAPASVSPAAPAPASVSPAAPSAPAPSASGGSAPAAAPAPAGSGASRPTSSVTGQAPTSSIAQGQQTILASSGIPSSASAQLMDYIKATETFTPTAFWDHKQWTNGFGTKAKFPTGGPNDPGPKETVTKEEAENRFSNVVNSMAQRVSGFGKSKSYRWGQNQVDALTSFIFNGGPGWLNQVSADGKRTNAQIADSILLYNKASGKELAGLTKRRTYESQLFRQDLQAANGGMFTGPKSGYPATLHGAEAVIPLKNGTVPVSLSMTDVLGGLSDDISEQLKEIQDQTVSANDTALRQVTSEFKTAMAQLSQQLSENARTQNQDNMSGIYALMEELVSATKSGVSVQQKILASSY